MATEVLNSMANYLRFEKANPRYALVVEDDDRVVYAYLIKDGAIVGDVWLYNRGATPDEPEWRGHAKAPFKNAREFVSNSVVAPALQAIDVTWHDCGSDKITVELNVNGELFASLAPGVKPGWCSNAAKNGPLAKILTEYIDARHHGIECD